MPDEKEFSSTMRIDIPPEELATAAQKTKKVDTGRIRLRPPTQRLRQQAAVETPDAKYDQLLQSIYDAALITDMQGYIVDSNVRAVEFLRYSRREFEGLNVLQIVSGADTSLLEVLCQNLQNEKFALIQAYCKRKDGSFFPTEIAVNMLKIEEPRFCFMIRDITVRRKAEEMLRTEHNAIQNSGNGIAIADARAKLEYVNPAILKLWGVEAQEEVLGTDLRALMADATAAERMVTAVLSDHQTWSGELVGKRKDGSTFDVQVSAACNRDSDGDVVGMVLSLVDITDRKLAEEALRQSDRQNVMLASVGAACHHLGQPATVILANLEIIRRMTTDVDKTELKDILRLTNEAAESMAEVLHKLNAINEYKTVQYLDHRDAKSPDNIILDI